MSTAQALIDQLLNRLELSVTASNSKITPICSKSSTTDIDISQEKINSSNLTNFWSKDLCGNHITISNEKIIKSGRYAETIYHSKILSSAAGSHSFQIKINKKVKSPKKDNIIIGITSDINGLFKNEDFASNKDSYYYGYRSDGKKTCSPNLYHSYVSNRFGTNDIITMYLNFDEQIIGFKSNNKDLGVAYNKVNTRKIKQYRFAVRIKTCNDSISILSYNNNADIVNVKPMYIPKKMPPIAKKKKIIKQRTGTVSHSVYDDDDSDDYYYSDGCVRCGITTQDSYIFKPLISCEICRNYVCKNCVIQKSTWIYQPDGYDYPVCEGGDVPVCSKQCGKEVETTNSFHDCNM
eukprot:441792_1